MKPGPRAWVYVAAVAFLGEGLVAPAVDFAGIAPDFAAIGTVILALTRGGAAGSVGGFALGLIIDLGDPLRLGLHALVLSVVGFACGRLRERLVYGISGVDFALAGLAALAHGTVVLMVEGGGGQPAPFLLQVVPSAVYSGLVSLPLLRLAGRLRIMLQDD